MSKNIVKQEYKITREDREKRNGHPGKVFWFTGLSGSGKSTLANQFEVELFNQGVQTYVLDGDNIRFGLNSDLMFTDEDRKENLRRIAEVAKLYVDAGMVVIAAFITPFEEDREKIKNIIGEDDFVHIYVDCPLEVCEERDVKGLYKKARNGEIKNFTGISSPFEPPKNNDLVIHSDKESLQDSLQKLLNLSSQKLKQ